MIHRQFIVRAATGKRSLEYRHNRLPLIETHSTCRHDAKPGPAPLPNNRVPGGSVFADFVG